MTAVGAAPSALRIVTAGWATTVQDRGRTGLAHLGVARAGAVDVGAHDLVNRLVGNAPGAATLETLGGLVVEAQRPLVVARSTDGSRHTLDRGDRLVVQPPAGRLWGYLAVRGGIDVEPVLGSRSHDTLSALGATTVASDVFLGVGADPRTELAAELAPDRPLDRPARIWDGPQHDWFAGGSSGLSSQTWVVSSDVSRVGVRLRAGDRPDQMRARTARFRDDLASFGLVEGAIQVTPSGEPIVMSVNHPPTGGYPVIAVVDPDDLVLVLQSPPGSAVRFERFVRS